jgi:hypothetical protein
MFGMVRMVIPGDHGVALVETFGQYSGFFHIRESDRSFGVFQPVMFADLESLLQQGPADRYVIYHIEPAETHFLLTEFIDLDMVDDHGDPSYDLRIAVGKETTHIRIAKHRIVLWHQCLYLILDQGRDPIRTIPVNREWKSDEFSKLFVGLDLFDLDHNRG